MRVEKITILTTGLGLTDMVSKIVDAQEHINGNYSFTPKGRKAHILKYQPIIKELWVLVRNRMLIILPEYAKCCLVADRVGKHYCLTIYNDEWQ